MGSFIAKNTKLEYDDGSGAVGLVEMVNIDGISTKSAQIDTTNHSTADLFRTSISGLKDLSEFTCTCNSNYAEYKAIFALATASPVTELSFIITYPFTREGGTATDVKLSFLGYFLDIPADTPVDNVMQYTISIAISGPVVLSDV